LIVCSILGGGVASVLQGRSDRPDPEDAGEVAPEAAGGFEQSLRDAIAANTGDVAALASLANLLANRGELSEAIDRYEDALELDPENATIRFDFATSLAEAGRRPDAELQFRRLLEVDPANVEALFYLAELYRAWQPPRTSEAADLYRRVVELGPDAYLADRATEELRRLGAAPGAPRGTPSGSAAADAEKERT
jgi:cytochrome c-type biogenesis protein CcmH/NrfG